MATLDSDLTARFPNLDADAVKEIIDTDLADSRIHAFMNMAYYMTRPLAGKLSQCGGKSAEEAIVKLLSAHYITTADKVITQQSIGDYSVKFGDVLDMGLNASRYGQDAQTMDCSGTLRKSHLRKASIRSVGYPDMTEQVVQVVL